MSIESLRAEVRKLCSLDVRYICREEANVYQLSMNSPANTDSHIIYILDCIPEEEKIQAEAHELGHIYVKEKGIICMESQGNRPFDFLILELNNSLSHRFVVSVLDKYGMSSQFHLNLRGKSIKTITEDIEELKGEVELLHGIGLRLYDISITIPELKNEAERLSKINNDVKAAYDAANIYFNQIRLGTPKEEQVDAVNNFFIKLGYNV